MYFLQITGIPFYLLPALYVSISIYLILKTTGKVITSSGISISRNAFIAIHFISITIAPLFIIALGLRFGLACFISIYASTLYSTGEMKSRKFILLSMLSVLTHFSVVAIVLSTVLSNVIKIKKSHVVIFGMIAFFLSGILLPLVVSRITLLNINMYAQAYLSGAFGSFENKNLNGMINYILQFMPFIILLTYYLRCSHPIKKLGIYNLCSMSIIMLAFSSIAPVAAGRFVLPVTYFLFFNYIYSKREHLKLRNIFLSFLVSFMVVFFIFENGYIQRRPILLGRMWQAIYEPPVINIMAVDDKFNSNLKNINPSNGEWYAHETDGS